VTEDEERTAIALAQLHPALGEMFRRAHGIIANQVTPVDVFVLSVLVRELTIGVVRELRATDPLIWGTPSIPEGETHRSNLGRVLELPPSDAMVLRWHVAHLAFNEGCHWEPKPSATPYVEHFGALSSILVSRFGPFFRTQDELTRLAALPAPTVDDAEALRPLLIMPAQREHFFDRLETSAWFPLLVTIGAFSRVPQAPPPQEWARLARWASWPEGGYLLRAAADHALEVERLLSEAGALTANPLVWQRIAATAAALPTEGAGRVAMALKDRLREISAWHLAEEALALARVLVQARAAEGIDLLTTLLSVDPAVTAEESSASQSYGWQREKAPVFAFLPQHTLDVPLPLIDEAIALAPSVMAERLLGLLKRAIALAARDGSEAATSKAWCRGIDEEDDERDPRPLLMRALARAVVAVGRSGDGAKCAELFQRLEGQRHDAFARIAWYAVAQLGPTAGEALGRCLTDERVYHEWWGNREGALLLRRQLKLAPEDVALVVRYMIERGPTPAEVTASLKWEETHTDADREAIVAEAVQRWQKRCLTWFRGEIPPLLEPLARRLGYSESPSELEVDLAEDHTSGGGAYWVAPTTSFSQEGWQVLDLAQMSDYLNSWTPETDDRRLDPVAGLYGLLRQWAETHPGRAEALMLSHGQDLPGGTFAPLLDGMKAGIRSGADVSISSLPAITGFVQAHGSGAADRLGGSLTANLRAVVTLIEEGASRDSLPPKDWAVGVATLAQVSQEKELFAAVLAEPEISFETVSLNGWNSLAGDITDACATLGLAMYRGIRKADAAFLGSEAESLVSHGLVPILNRLLQLDGQGGGAVRHQLGQYLAGLRVIAPEWVATRVVAEFSSGITDPIGWPIWPSYLVWNRLYNEVYREWVAWYRQAAEVMPVDSGSRALDQSPYKALITHLTVAYLRGLAEITAESGTMEIAYSRAHPEMLASVYWSLFRDFEDSEDPDQQMLERIWELWRWRLDVLEGRGDASGSNEEAGGLLWFVVLKRTPAALAVSLGVRTLSLIGTATAVVHSVWTRLGPIADAEPSGALSLVSALLRTEAKNPYRHLDYADAALLCRSIRGRVPDAEWQVFTTEVDNLARKGWTALRQLVE